MKDSVVVEAVLHVAQEVVDGDRRLVGRECEQDRAREGAGAGAGAVGDRHRHLRHGNGEVSALQCGAVAGTCRCHGLCTNTRHDAVVVGRRGVAHIGCCAAARHRLAARRSHCQSRVEVAAVQGNEHRAAVLRRAGAHGRHRGRSGVAARIAATAPSTTRRGDEQCAERKAGSQT